MGYADTVPYQQLELASQLEYQSLTATTVLTETVVTDIVFPAFKRPISQAYLDIIVQYAEDTSAADNYTTIFWYLKDTGGTSRACGVANTALFTKASQYWNGYYIFQGYTDLHAYVTPAATQDISIKLQAHGNNLILKHIKGKMRLYFNV